MSTSTATSGPTCATPHSPARANATHRATRCASAWPTSRAIRTKARSTSPIPRSIRAPAPSAPAPCSHNADRRFTPGLFARVQLEGARESTALLIDDKAVLTDQDRKYVYVLGPDNKALRKDVELGRMADGLRVVAVGPDRTGPGDRRRRAEGVHARHAGRPADRRDGRAAGTKPAAGGFGGMMSASTDRRHDWTSDLPRLPRGRGIRGTSICFARQVIGSVRTKVCNHGLLQVLHRPADLRRGAVDRHLRRRPDRDAAAADRRNIPTWCRRACRCARSTRAPTPR